MTHATRIDRLVGLAVGLGIGAALAATPGIASADDFQISIDGMDLFPTDGNTATATSGMGDIAIAFGVGSDASASGGVGDYAFADGAGTDAGAGSSAGIPGSYDFALATGAGSIAGAGGGNFDTAMVNGNDSVAVASGDAVTDGGTTTNYLANNDFAYVLGSNSQAYGGNYFGVETDSNYDTAMVIDPFGTAGSTASAGTGDYDFAAAFGDMLHAMAVAVNDMITILPSLYVVVRQRRYLRRPPEMPTRFGSGATMPEGATPVWSSCIAVIHWDIE